MLTPHSTLYFLAVQSTGLSHLSLYQPLWFSFYLVTMKRATSKSVVSNEFDREIDWELRPGGMLVQKRDAVEASSGPMIKIEVSHGSYHHDITVPAQSTFGNYLITLWQFCEYLLYLVTLVKRVHAHVLVWCFSFSPFDSFFDGKFEVGHCNKSQFGNLILSWILLNFYICNVMNKVVPNNWFW